MKYRSLLEDSLFSIHTEAYSEPCETSKMDCFAKIVKSTAIQVTY